MKTKSSSSLRLRLGLLLSLGVASGACAQTTDRVSVGPLGQQLPAGCIQASLSADGRFVAFVSYDPLVGNGVHVREVATGAIVLASTTGAGVAANGLCFYPKLSRDGRFVAFASTATNLAASDNNGAGTDVFVKDLRTGALDHVSRNNAGVGGNGSSIDHELSADGMCVSFHSYATNLVPNDANGLLDAFLFDRQSQRVECLSNDPSGIPIGSSRNAASVSGDGRLVVLELIGTAVGLPAPPGGPLAIVLRDRVAKTATVLNLDAGSLRHARAPYLSADGSTAAFASKHPFVPSDTDGFEDVYVVDLATGVRALVTPPTSHAAPSTWVEGLSRDGRFVVFTSTDAFDPAVPGGALNVFLADRARHEIERISKAPLGGAADGASGLATVSDHGRLVLFLSKATNLVTADTNGENDAFLRDRATPASSQLYGAGFPGSGGQVPAFGLLGRPTIGTVPSFAIGNPSLVATAGLLVVGGQAVSIPTPFGGTLLASPDLVTSFQLPATGLVFPVALPDLMDLVGVQLFLQGVVVDAGAAAGLAFSRGLHLVLGG